VVPPPAVVPPTIAKAFAMPSIVVNATTMLTFTLTNPNPGTALTGVGFIDMLPAGLVVDTPNGLASTCGGTVTAVAAAGSVDLINGGLPASGSCTITLNVTGTTGGVKTNTTSAITSTEGGTGGIASASLAVIAPTTIDKAFGTPIMLVNGTTTLTFTVANPAGNGAALTGVAFTDALPAGLVVATPNGLMGSCGGGTITATAGGPSISLAGATLGAGISCVFSINVQAVAAGTQVNTTSAVTSTEGGTGGTAVAFLVVVAPPVVAPPTIAKAFGTPIMLVNGTTTLTFTPTNPNPGTALTGVGFTDTLPAGLVVATPNGLASTCEGTVTAVAGTGNVDLINGGLPASGSCTITVNVTGATAGVKNNTTSAVTSTEGGTGGAASASLAVVAPPAVVPPTIAKAFAVPSIVVNGTTTLTFTLTNPNPGTVLTGVGFTDTLPAGLVVATPNGLASTCGGTVTAVAGTGSIGLVNGGLAAGASCTITVNVTGATGGLKGNTTSAVTSTEGGAGGTASASLAVIAPPTIAKAFGAPSIVVNGATTLTFRLTNPNAGTALTGVGFTDTVPAGLVVATPNGLTGSCGGGTITATAGATTVGLAGATLAAGTSCVFAINAKGVATGSQVNTTSAVTSANGGAGNAATASVTVLGPTLAPNLIIAKSHAGSFVKGQTGEYTITVSNIGEGPTAGTVTVTDTLPAGLTATSLSGAGWTCALVSLSCTRSDALAAGTSYAPITLTVSIAVTAPDSLDNTATVSGGGDTSPVDNTVTDSTSLAGVPIPTLSTFALAVFVIVVLLSGLRLLRRRHAAGR
jgi:uncharacterized repeat protein (TIGR01451 family)